MNEEGWVGARIKDINSSIPILIHTRARILPVGRQPLPLSDSDYLTASKAMRTNGRLGGPFVFFSLFDVHFHRRTPRTVRATCAI
uniref:Phosphatidylinositol-4-phosphate 5-kinase n=1 Tax=Caenorhabditis tropicalis TaxID=1561998 RepID=A0A1I7TCW8_9PELO